MKKIRNLVIGGLEQKIFNLVLFSIILIVLAFMGVAVYQTRSLSSLFQKTNEEQKTAVTDSTTAIMEGVIDTTMTREASLEAYIADSMFREVAAQVITLADITRDLYANPDDLREIPSYAPDPQKQGIPSVQLITAAGVDTENPEIAREIGRLGNLQVAMSSIYKTIDQANSCFVATPDGILLIADSDPQGKIREDGTVINIPVTEREWYKGAVRNRGIYFTGLQQDIFTGRKEIVCSYPVYLDGELVAVAGADLFLEAMEKAIMETGETAGFVCIVDQDGRVIFSPQRSGTFAPALADSAVDLRKSANADLAAFAKKAMTVNTDVVRIQVDGTDYYMTGSPIGSIGWALFSVIDAATVHEPVDIMAATHDAIVGEAAGTAEKNAGRSQVFLIIFLLVAMVLALAGSLSLAKRIVAPINDMAREVASLNDSNPLFKMKNEYRTDDEIEVLAESFADISAKTQTYIKHITEITAEKERIGTELELATKIQADMLPNIFPPFPGRKELDIFATMEPAKEVGGDFYDFFLIDDDHLAMVMADVSGKGVPAALFMMMSKILVNNNTMLCDFPNEVLERVNDQICKNNEEDMFVTVWLGILTISTGHVVASNAGHEYPIIRKKSGEFELLKDRHSFVIGGMPDITYRKYEFVLERGGTLFLYTDGVPETTDSDNVMFGTDRMLEVLNSEPDADAAQVINNVYRAVKDFAGDVPQFDDITMMAVKLR